jgi:hypothetical protein
VVVLPWTDDVGQVGLAAEALDGLGIPADPVAGRTLR